jgi:peroxiredoxin Q/BCP
MRRLLSGFLALAGVTAFAPAPAADLKPGDPAPAFRLEGSDGKTHDLADLKGKTVVVSWFPKAFTGGCTIECKSLHESGAEIRKFDAVYFAASVDDAATNKKFAESLSADYPILSDPDKKVAEAYGVLKEGGYAARWTFYIGPDGKILAIDKQVKPASAAQDIAAQLESLGVKKLKS